ncbi:protein STRICTOSIDINE SYNTHASE-LIKE 3-like [Asparagus officinalis]|uniref:protein STRICTOSIDINE SYNTHASE-LIKE 3-like n=1 Tax=Asparagus officinalis TaxID=4686 RepID=UPI00098E50D8|nr:protein STRICTOSIDINE SYNTHASE-LIKE 3-like [Asparagus officinalis]
MWELLAEQIALRDNMTLGIAPLALAEAGLVCERLRRGGLRATTSPDRSEICDPKPSALSYLKNEHICGRPLGLRFDKKTGDMYIADAYFGILKVGPEGGLAAQLVAEVEGRPLRFTNDLDIDEDGNVYFTESSTYFQRRNYVQMVLTAEPSGRLLKFDPITKKTTVLVRELQNPNGVSLKARTLPQRRLSRYWLKGEKAGTSETFVILPGHPDNVRTNAKGEFWVAIHCRRTLFLHVFNLCPRLRKFIFKFPIKAQYIYTRYIGGKHHGMIVKYSEDGSLLRVLEDREGKVVRAVSEVEEHDGKLWIGSVLMPFIAVY